MQQRQRGQSLSDYLLILGLIAVTSIAVVGTLGSTIRSQVVAMTQELAGMDATADLGLEMIWHCCRHVMRPLRFTCLECVSGVRVRADRLGLKSEYLLISTEVAKGRWRSKLRYPIRPEWLAWMVV